MIFDLLVLLLLLVVVVEQWATKKVMFEPKLWLTLFFSLHKFQRTQINSSYLALSKFACVMITPANFTTNAASHSPNKPKQKSLFAEIVCAVVFLLPLGCPIWICYARFFLAFFPYIWPKQRAQGRKGEYFLGIERLEQKSFDNLYRWDLLRLWLDDIWYPLDTVRLFGHDGRGKWIVLHLFRITHTIDTSACDAFRKLYENTFSMAAEFLRSNANTILPQCFS